MFIRENAFENVVWKMAAMLSRPQCVNMYRDCASNGCKQLCKRLWPRCLTHITDATLKQNNHRVNTLRPRQNGRHFADDIFKCIFLNENVSISIKISLKFVPKGPINNIAALVQIMAWRRPGDKPLSEPVMVNLPTHICVTRPQWV